MSIGQETKAFNTWLKEKFTWVDNDVKRLMFKTWMARASKKRRYK